MSRQWTWFRPSNLDEVVGLIVERGSDAVLIAGGTALSLNPPRRENLAMVDLQSVGLDRIDVGKDEVRLGAMVTASDVARSCDVETVGAGMLRDTCSFMGPTPVRNRITVGGNVMQAFRWCDLPVSLFALGAQFEVFGPGSSTRLIDADSLFDSQPRKSLSPGELLAAVRVKTDSRGQAGAFIKMGQTLVDHAIVSAAAFLTLDGGTCSAARVTVGALTALPQRLEKVEEKLIGRKLDARTIEEASQAAGEANVHGDRRADEDYRRDMAKVFVRRAVETAAVRARITLEGGGAC